MSQVAMTINGRVYRLSCEDGDEERLLQLASEVGARVDEFAESFGQVGENRLLLLAGLRLADELLDAREVTALSRGAPKKRVKSRDETVRAVRDDQGGDANLSDADAGAAGDDDQAARPAVSPENIAS